MNFILNYISILSDLPRRGCLPTGWPFLTVSLILSICKNTARGCLVEPTHCESEDRHTSTLASSRVTKVTVTKVTALRNVSLQKKRNLNASTESRRVRGTAQSSISNRRSTHGRVKGRTYMLKWVCNGLEAKSHTIG